MKLKKKLFSYNTKKHPKVDRFLDNIETGMHSHYIREAIEFYAEHHGYLKSFSFVKTSLFHDADMDNKFFDSILWYLSKY